VETRHKFSQIHRAMGTRPKNGTKVWTPEEDQLDSTVPASEVVELTGRTLKAGYSRRVRLGLLDGRCSGISKAETGKLRQTNAKRR
jgi:hypothetical protein